MLFLVKYDDYIQSVLTILTSATQPPLAKAFSGLDFKVQTFAIGKVFNITEEPASNLQSLSKVLQRLDNDPTRTIIRGLLTEGKTTSSPATKKSSLLHLANGA